MITQIKYGNKIKPIPYFYEDFYEIPREGFYARSRDNIEALEKLYGINFHTFLKYHVKGVKHCGYVAYGSLGRQNITYLMYKHSGNNIGDVWVYFGRGKKVYNSSARFYLNGFAVYDYHNFCMWHNFIGKYVHDKSPELRKMRRKWIEKESLIGYES